MGKFFDNKERVVLVTGGARGIGWGIIKSFLQNQNNIVICIDIEKPNEIEMKKIGNKIKRLYFYQTNISNEKEVLELYDNIKNRFGKLDILINNAGIIYKDLIENMSLSKWNKLLEVNLTGVMLMTRGAVSFMKEQMWGRVINISSMQAFIGTEVYG